MNVEFDANVNRVGCNSTVQTTVQKRPQPRDPMADSVSLDQTASLDQSFAAAPQVRSEALERARKLVADPTYPSEKTIWKIATLLADRINATEE